MILTHGFELIKQETIAELNNEARFYRHVQSGAELLSLVNKDENKVFGITFRTPPANSTGVAHIMEHAVLGGSRKYQVKEPFVELLKGSLNTFLNAFTASDWTTYPVASQNLQDFYNLVDVYLDAVFYPLITPHHLDQEGWHYELEELNEPLTYKGVVYNEMKGAFSSPDSLFSRYNQRSLFEDHIYGNESGGDPAEIPNLTYKMFKDFHKDYYHPGNARIVIYGDDDPEERLRLLNAYLKEFEVRPVDSAIPLAKRFSEPKHFTFPYSIDDDSAGDSKGRLQVNWLLPENNNPVLTMALSILSYALVSTPASPLRKALIDSGLGEELTGGGLSNNLREMVFNVGLKGIDCRQSDQVESLILDTLTRLAEEGLEPEMIEAAVNSIEFQLRENNTGRFPRGLSLMLQAMTTWIHDGDPLVMLAYEAPLNSVKERLATDPTYFQELIRQHLLANRHRTTVLLEPDGELAQRLIEEEQARLDAAREGMQESDLQAIVDNTVALRRLQETPDTAEALASIPMLTMADLDKESRVIPITVDKAHSAELIFHDLFTNGIVYLDAGLNLAQLPSKLLPYVNLVGSAFTDMGTMTEDYVKLSQRISTKTGGIWHSTIISTTADRSGATAWLLLRGKATFSQSQALLDIFRDVLLTVKLDDKDRFRQIVLEAKAGEEAGLVNMGHAVVRNRLASALNEAAWVSEKIDGLDYLFFLNELIEKIESDWPAVLTDLEAVRETLVNRRNMFVNVTLDGENYGRVRPQITDFLSVLPAPDSTPVARQASLVPNNEGLTIPARVNYVAKGANLYDSGYELDGSVSVITNYLGTTWLWEKVRVQGGAYGGFSTFDRYSGLFSYVSYRDPNLTGTLDNYDSTAAFLRNLSLNNEELVKSIIGTIGNLDAYQLPDAKGYTSLIRHLVGVSDESRQMYRDQVLATTGSDFKLFAEALDYVKDSGLVVAMGSAEAINAANESNWLKVTKVL
jgi:Zn-dependent M16 (insulinase) family peptidase